MVLFFASLLFVLYTRVPNEVKDCKKEYVSFIRTIKLTLPFLQDVSLLWLLLSWDNLSLRLDVCR
jgi:hypothetical protein